MMRIDNDDACLMVGRHQKLLHSLTKNSGFSPLSEVNGVEVACGGELIPSDLLGQIDSLLGFIFDI